MNNEDLTTTVDGGVQTILPACTDTPQIVYLDFDGASASYCNRELGIAVGDVTVEPSGFGDDATAAIAASLNGMFDDVVFTTEIPSDGAFSTIYVGVASAFDGYGGFLGLAETIDSGNRIHDDNAFILLDSSATAELVVSVIAHETEHIVYGMDHGGDGLARYAAIYIINNGEVSSGLTIEDSIIFRVYSGGTAVGTTLNSNGHLYVSDGGTVVSTTVNYFSFVRVNAGGTAVSTSINGAPLNVSSGGDLHVSSGGTAVCTMVNSGGFLHV